MTKPSEELLRKAEEWKARNSGIFIPDLEKMAQFAEEIVRECAKIANSERRVWNADAPAPQQRISAEILRKFGLKE